MRSEAPELARSSRARPILVLGVLLPSEVAGNNLVAPETPNRFGWWCGFFQPSPGCFSGEPKKRKILKRKLGGLARAGDRVNLS